MGFSINHVVCLKIDGGCDKFSAGILPYELFKRKIKEPVWGYILNLRQILWIFAFSDDKVSTFHSRINLTGIDFEKFSYFVNIRKLAIIFFSTFRWAAKRSNMKNNECFHDN